MDEFFDIVNIKDEVMGRASRFETHEKGYFHRAIHVFVRKDEKTWFLQRRSARKDLDPLLWTTTCSGHVDAGESYLMAAMRECEEELGLNLVEDSFLELLRLSPCVETGNEFVRVYAISEYHSSIRPNRDEIMEMGEYNLGKISMLIEKSPEMFSKSFLHVFKLIESRLLKIQ